MNTWGSILFTDIEVASGVTSSFIIFGDSDWKPAGGTSRGTIKRIRGWFSIIYKDTAGAEAFGIPMCYVAVYDEDDTSLGADIIGTYTDEDILWTGGTMMPFVDAGGPGFTKDFVLDIKAQRRFKNGQDVRLVMTNVSTSAFQVSGVCRALLTRGT